jgi:hypothetical protein
VNFDHIIEEAEARRPVNRTGTAGKTKDRDQAKSRVSLQLHAIVLMDKHITKCLHGHDYDRNLSLNVERADVWMQKGHLLQKLQRVGKEKAKYVAGEAPDQRHHLQSFPHWT